MWLLTVLLSIRIRSFKMKLGVASAHFEDAWGVNSAGIMLTNYKRKHHQTHGILTHFYPSFWGKPVECALSQSCTHMVAQRAKLCDPKQSWDEEKSRVGTNTDNPGSSAWVLSGLLFMDIYLDVYKLSWFQKDVIIFRSHLCIPRVMMDRTCEYWHYSVHIS